MARSRFFVPRPRWAALAAVLGLALVACADDDTGDASPDPEATTTTEPSSGEQPTTTTTTTTTTTEPEPLFERSLEVVVEEHPDGLSGFRLTRPVDLEALDEPFPVVVWGNGACLRHDRPWVPMFERWAEAGIVTISVTRPPDADPDASPFEVGNHTAEDQALAIDWLIEQTENVGGPYEGAFDPDRVVAAGNSCGGITSLALAGEDDRVRGIFVLSGSSVGPGASEEDAAAVMDLVSVPVAYVVGGLEDIATDQAHQDYGLLGDGIAAYVAQRSEGDHLEVSTDEGIVDEAAEIGLHWLDLIFYGSVSAADALAESPCPSCAADLWAIEAKHLDSLVG